MMFSVVIPVYNKETTVARAVRSVFAQVCRDYEIVAVNDGSLDGSLAVLRNLESESKNLGVDLRIVDKKNEGVSATRNRGVREARGDWVMFLDADDYYLPRFLAEMADLISRNPEAGMAGSNYYVLNEGVLRSYLLGFTAGYVNYFRYWMPLWILFNSSSFGMRRKTFLHIGGFREDLRFYEDAELMFRAAFTAKVVATPEPLAVYTDDAPVKLSRQGGVRITEKLPHVRLLDKRIEEGCASAEELRCARRWVSQEIKVAYLQHESVENVMALYIATLSTSPGIKKMASSRLLPLYVFYLRVRDYVVAWMFSRRDRSESVQTPKTV
jgi:glycosyltransferase involved in cell wall biosynthesis